MGSDLSAPGPARSALGELLDRSIVHEQTGAPLPAALIRYGLVADAVTILVALLGLLVAHPAELGHSSFLLLLSSLAATLGGVLHAVAIPLLVLGVILLALGVWLSMEPRPRSGGWRHAIVGQALLGGAAGTASAAFVAIFLINAIIWLAIVTAIAWVILVCLSGWE